MPQRQVAQPSEPFSDQRPEVSPDLRERKYQAYAGLVGFALIGLAEDEQVLRTIRIARLDG